MCDWWLGRSKSAKCKARPAHATETKAMAVLQSLRSTGTTCGTENEVKASHITITEAGAECPYCKTGS